MTKLVSTTQSALNKTPNELAKLSDGRLKNVLNAARKQAKYPTKEYDPIAHAQFKFDYAKTNLAQLKKAGTYYDTVITECNKRPHFN